MSGAQNSIPGARIQNEAKDRLRLFAGQVARFGTRVNELKANPPGVHKSTRAAQRHIAEEAYFFLRRRKFPKEQLLPDLLANLP